MKNRILLTLALAAIPSLSFADTMPTNDAPVGLQPASQGSHSGDVVELFTGVPAQVMTSLGQTGWLVMDSNGAYWYGHDIDRNGRLIGAYSAPQGTYAKLETGQSVVVR